MKADLYTAQARTVGTGGLAHRTAAGFVVLTSADGSDLIELIDAKQNEADLIDQVVGHAQKSTPTAFAMLFTAGGELYLIASGSAAAVVSTTSGQFTIGAATDQILVYPVSGGMGEAAAAISLHVQGSGDTQSAGTEAELRDGTVPADSIGLTIGSAAIHRLTADMPRYQAPTSEPGEASEPGGQDPAASEVATDAGEPPEEATDAASATGVPEPAAPEAAEVAERMPFEDPDEPGDRSEGHVLLGGAADIEEPDVEPVAILPPTNDATLPGDPVVSEAAHPPPEPPVPEPPAPPAPPMPAAVPAPPTPPMALIPEPPTPAAPPVSSPAPPPPAIPEPPVPAPVEPAATAEPAPIPDPPVPAPAPEAAIPDPPAPAPVPEAAIPDPPVPAPVAEAAIPDPPVPAPVAEGAIPDPPAPAPVAEGAIPDPPAPASLGPVMVLGVACSQHHHNHPDAVYCSQCGTKMGVHHTTVLINGPRPPLGVLVVDDGTTYSLSQDLVIGREPTTHDDVVAGTASPMILADDTLSLSRKHARIVLDEWSVLVQDLGSSNGTYLSRAGHAENWTRIPPSSTNPLEPGDRLRVGGRIIQVELHHVR